MSLKIIKAGILDSIQDSGRNGYRHLGINPTGAMDRFSAQLANALLGKDLTNPVIEMHFPASQILFEKPTIISLTGADFSASINYKSIPSHQPVLIPAGSMLQFKRLNSGAHCYMALLHDLQVDKWLGSASTNIKVVAGGYGGRSLQKEDVIFFKESLSLKSLADHKELTVLHWKLFPAHVDEIIECIKGPEWEWLSGEAQWNFQNKSFAISNLSDRMGYRFFGEELEVEKNKEMVSSAVDFGTVQRLPNGQLIILMADHQTTGGYPRVAHVCATSLPSLAQLKAGNEIRFRFISIGDAEDKLLQQQKYLEQLQNACKLKIEKFLYASV